jgi:hypothetical protein
MMGKGLLLTVPVIFAVGGDAMMGSQWQPQYINGTVRVQPGSSLNVNVPIVETKRENPNGTVKVPSGFSLSVKVPIVGTKRENPNGTVNVPSRFSLSASSLGGVINNKSASTTSPSSPSPSFTSTTVSVGGTLSNIPPAPPLGQGGDAPVIGRNTTQKRSVIEPAVQKNANANSNSLGTLLAEIKQGFKLKPINKKAEEEKKVEEENAVKLESVRFNGVEIQLSTSRINQMGKSEKFSEAELIEGYEDLVSGEFSIDNDDVEILNGYHKLYGKSSISIIEMILIMKKGANNKEFEYNEKDRIKIWLSLATGGKGLLDWKKIKTGDDEVTMDEIKQFGKAAYEIFEKWNKTEGQKIVEEVMEKKERERKEEEKKRKEKALKDEEWQKKQRRIQRYSTVVSMINDNNRTGTLPQEDIE